MPTKRTELPKGLYTGLIGFPFCKNLEDLKAEITILGIPYGLPHYSNQFANDQSLAPDLLRKNAQDRAWHGPRTISYFDWDLLNGSSIQVVDCGNVTSDRRNPRNIIIGRKKP